MIKCEKHEWLYEEFDEPCPLCDAVKVHDARILKLIDRYMTLTSGQVFDTYSVLESLRKDVEVGELD